MKSDRYFGISKTMNTRIIPMNQPDQWFDQISGFQGFLKKIDPSFRCEFSPVINVLLTGGPSTVVAA